jgi:hypothetical protein
MGWLAYAGLLAGGCGSIPDVIVDSARSSAQENFQQAIENVINDVIEETIAELFDLADFEVPFAGGSADEEGGDAFEAEGGAVSAERLGSGP